MFNRKLVISGLTVLVFLKLAGLSIARYQGYNARAFDLGIMSQAIWSVTQGYPLVFTIEGIPLSRLARHVEVIYFLFAPAYALWPDPQILVILQAGLFAAGAWPLYRLVNRRVGHSMGPIVAIYLFYPVAQTAVLFDFHGDTIAMPLLLFVIEALDRQAWRSYTFWLILSLCCKFYIAALVLGLGGLLWWQGQKKVGIITAVGGLVWGVTAFFVIRPLFAPMEGTLVQATSASYLAHYFGNVAELSASISLRTLTALIVYLPALLIGWRAPLWLLLGSVIALPTLLSTGPGPSYDYRYHHYALAVPFFITAIVYGLVQTPRPRGIFKRLGSPALLSTLLLTLLMNSLFVDSPLNPQFYQAAIGSARGLDSSGYGVTARDRFKDQWLSEYVPSTAPLAADATLAPHLTNRPTLYLTRHPKTPPPKTLNQLLSSVDYVVVDSLFDFVIGDESSVTGGVNYEHNSIKTLLNQPDFSLHETGDGLLLFGRGADGLQQMVSTTPLTNSRPLQAKFDQQIGLVSANIEQVTARRYRLTFSWIAQANLNETELMAVSELKGVPHSRFVHLPTRILHPPADWQTDELVTEQFEIDLPNNLPAGQYPLVVGWYRTNHVASPLTDSRTRLGESVETGVIRTQLKK